MAWCGYIPHLSNYTATIRFRVNVAHLYVHVQTTLGDLVLCSLINSAMQYPAVLMCHQVFQTCTERVAILEADLYKALNPEFRSFKLSLKAMIELQLEVGRALSD